MSKYINLIDKLTDTDKETIKAYINAFGCDINDFIGIDKWLENWSHANQKLYKILGNSLIREFPYQYEKSPSDIRRDFKNLLDTSNFKAEYYQFYVHYLREQGWVTDVERNFFLRLLDVDNFINDKISWSLKIKKPNAKKMLQIQAGAKPIKAFGRVIEYFKDDYEFNKSYFEEFKKEYAMILSEKTITGKFCISIHPMDFMTMSDNASNWTSCMNWARQGCYHTGTIEMMNSNNVVCAYLIIGDKKFVFDDKAVDPNTGEVYGIWNNKKWRQLFYVTKDIIMSGKAYPYFSKEMTLTVLDHIHDLAGTAAWKYQFGPELYQDMVHVSNIYKMNNQRMWAKSEKHTPFKHNIIWDTKGMYNDMLNDNTYSYWCYRNKVDSTKIISVSGKAPCLCCGKSIISEKWEDDDYNDRFSNTDSAVCETCQTAKYKCLICGETHYKFNSPLHRLENGKVICRKCLPLIRVCPCCGEIFYCNYNTETRTYVYNKEFYEYIKQGGNAEKMYPRYIYADVDGYEDIKDVDLALTLLLTKEKIEQESKIYVPIERLHIHTKCYNKVGKEFLNNSIRIELNRGWSHYKEKLDLVDPAIAEKYRFLNMRQPSLNAILKADLKPTI